MYLNEEFILHKSINCVAVNSNQNISVSCQLNTTNSTQAAIIPQCSMLSICTLLRPIKLIDRY